MKKVLSLILAVVLVFSMATVAFAAGATKTCDICGYETTLASEYNAHITAKDCGRCAYCGNGFETSAELAEHQYSVCLHFSATCDYCGKANESTEEAFDAHVAVCKVNYFYIPLAKIIAAVQNYISKIDFKKAFEGAKNFFNEVVPVVQDIFGSISK